MSEAATKRVVALALSAIVASACAVVLGIDEDYHPEQAAGAGTSGTAAGTAASSNGGTSGTGATSGGGASGAGGGAGGCNEITLRPSDGIDAADMMWVSNTGESCAGSMYLCVDDTTPDGDDTYVYATKAGGYHRVAYWNAPNGAPTSVTVHAVAAQPSGTETVTLTLFDADTVIGSGVHTLTSTYADVSDTFSTTAASANDLRSRVSFSAAGGKYTQTYIVVTLCGK